VNGARALIHTLVDAGVRTCFTNPGTSEMHFVAALDAVPQMRAVLTLFEGVATGAADGYARMADAPGATLLHLGPGLGNGLANLHNARRARSPIVNVVGEHATFHRRFDAPLESDIETVARNCSRWVRTTQSAAELSRDAVEAVAAAQGPPGQVATLILPADVSWSDGAQVSPPPAPPRPRAAAAERIERVAGVLRQRRRTAILLGGRALRRDALLQAARIAAASGAQLLAEVFPARLERGAGLPSLERLAYIPELCSVQLAGLSHLILVDARRPASFFAYPGRDSDLVPGGCEVHELCAGDEDLSAALEALVEELGAARTTPALQARSSAPDPTGPLTPESVCQAVAAVLPEGAIVSDETQTSGFTLPAASAGAPPHDLLALTGGAIGQGLPVAVGAAIACPDRRVLALEADGSSLYTIQALWTMAREQLDVTTVILNNRSYAILNVELERVGARATGSRARAQLDLAEPQIDFVALAAGLGVPAIRVARTEELVRALRRGISEPGPQLIEAVVPHVLSGWQLRALPHALRGLAALPAPVAKAIKRRLYP
jgi:acetolactate synthase-1/2/3 large subunit